MRHLRFAPLFCLAIAVAAACGAPAAVTAPSPPEASAPAATPAPTLTAAPTAPAGCTSGFTVRSGHITVRINEKAGPVVLHEAVIEAPTVTGGFALSSSGAFTSCSLVAADLRQLKSTDDYPGEAVLNRDEVIHGDFLKTSQFPFAVLQLREASALPVPLPAQGSWSFSLDGSLSMHGKTNDVRWHVDARRQAGTLTATATTSVTFDDFNIDRPNQILGLDQLIRIEVTIEAADS